MKTHLLQHNQRHKMQLPLSQNDGTRVQLHFPLVQPLPRRSCSRRSRIYHPHLGPVTESTLLLQSESRHRLRPCLNKDQKIARTVHVMRYERKKENKERKKELWFRCEKMICGFDYQLWPSIDNWQICFLKYCSHAIMHYRMYQFMSNTSISP